MTKQKKLFNAVMKENKEKGLKKGKGKKPLVTCGAFGKCYFLPCNWREGLSANQKTWKPKRRNK